jgi:hypothetical protein
LVPPIIFLWRILSRLLCLLPTLQYLRPHNAKGIRISPFGRHEAWDGGNPWISDNVESVSVSDPKSRYEPRLGFFRHGSDTSHGIDGFPIAKRLHAKAGEFIPRRFVARQFLSAPKPRIAVVERHAQKRLRTVFPVTWKGSIVVPKSVVLIAPSFDTGSINEPRKQRFGRFQPEQWGETGKSLRTDLNPETP